MGYPGAYIFRVDENIVASTYKALGKDLNKCIIDLVELHMLASL